MRKNKKFTLTKLLGMCLIFVGLAACNSGSSGDPGTVAPPPPSDGGNGGGGGGNPPPPPPPPPVTSTWDRFIDYELCYSGNKPEIQVEPGNETWGDSYDAFILRQSGMRGNKYCYAGRLARPHDPLWTPGSWWFAAFAGDDEGRFTQFLNGGWPDVDVYINGVKDDCVVLGNEYQGKLEAIIEDAHRLTHTHADIDGNNRVSQQRQSWPCNNGQTCYLNCNNDLH